LFVTIKLKHMDGPQDAFPFIEPEDANPEHTP